MHALHERAWKCSPRKASGRLTRAIGWSIGCVSNIRWSGIVWWSCCRRMSETTGISNVSTGCRRWKGTLLIRWWTIILNLWRASKKVEMKETLKQEEWIYFCKCVDHHRSNSWMLIRIAGRMEVRLLRSPSESREEWEKWRVAFQWTRDAAAGSLAKRLIRGTFDGLRVRNG